MLAPVKCGEKLIRKDIPECLIAWQDFAHRLRYCTAYALEWKGGSAMDFIDR